MRLTSFINFINWVDCCLSVFFLYVQLIKSKIWAKSPMRVGYEYFNFWANSMTSQNIRAVKSPSRRIVNTIQLMTRWNSCAFHYFFVLFALYVKGNSFWIVTSMLQANGVCCDTAWYFRLSNCGSSLETLVKTRQLYASLVCLLSNQIECSSFNA